MTFMNRKCEAPLFMELELFMNDQDMPTTLTKFMLMFINVHELFMKIQKLSIKSKSFDL